MNIYIESKNNSVLKYVLKLLKSSSFRKENSEFIVEGVRLCQDAFFSCCEIKALIYTKNAYMKYKNIICDLEMKSKKTYILNEKLFSYISDTKSPQGVMCICHFLDKHFSLDKISNNERLVTFENIQDPSNLGTMLRTAEALGIDNIILSDDCCDIYNPKVLRGSMGAVFRLKFFKSKDLKNTISELNKLGFKTYASVPDSNAEKIINIKLNRKSVIVIGNEGNGLKKSTIDSCLEKVTIPMNGKAESLNAAMASGILMWELVRGG